MELKEIEIILAKLQKVGSATCESCQKQFKFFEVDVFNGVYLCPACLRKAAWHPERTVELTP
jgi:formylmethanofuran dehydrogenase subunit E